ncbi:hypothetical protein XELAEV_18028289mg [Xenopus laevis]|uniref:Uncharacterized protein n=1 Tax=Xenopus laevis TaxID=8355 RepID=A0A974HKJ7_XENLA|nr:hypothetical protein XELAEV_18028289mg [Xenopus laevis]
MAAAEDGGTDLATEQQPLANGDSTNPAPARDTHAIEGSDRGQETQILQCNKCNTGVFVAVLIFIAIIIVPVSLHYSRNRTNAQRNNGTDAAEETVADGETVVDKDNETARDCERLVYVSDSDGSFQSSYDSCASKGYELLKEPDIETVKLCIPNREDFWISSPYDCKQCRVYNTEDGVRSLDPTTIRHFLCAPQAASVEEKMKP